MLYELRSLTVGTQAHPRLPALQVGHHRVPRGVAGPAARRPPGQCLGHQRHVAGDQRDPEQRAHRQHPSGRAAEAVRGAPRPPRHVARGLRRRAARYPRARRGAAGAPALRGRGPCGLVQRHGGQSPRSAEADGEAPGHAPTGNAPGAAAQARDPGTAAAGRGVLPSTCLPGEVHGREAPELARVPRRGRRGTRAGLQRDVAGNDHDDVDGQGPSLAARGVRASSRCRHREHPQSIPVHIQQGAPSLGCFLRYSR
mmetsp:Transcript_37726/g.117608  ORF Transcript_37726/g.117608 Transcript_37726/m.117608 type:complete len:255 (+) Transcript_37726:54-818(+)